MAFKYLTIIALTIHLVCAVSIPLTSVIIPPDGKIPDKNWIMVCYHELDEIDDEISEFKKSLNKIKTLCQSPFATDKCGSFVDLLIVGVERVKSDLDYVKTFDKGQNKQSFGRRNNFKLQTIDEATYVNFELPTTFQNISILNGKIDTLSKCQSCRVNIGEFGDIVNSISFNQMEKVYKLQKAIFNAQHGIATNLTDPIPQEQVIHYLQEVEKIIDDQTMYEIDADKLKNPPANLGNIDVSNNRILVEFVMPLKLKESIRERILSNHNA